jgi:hypothetical protein
MNAIVATRDLSGWGFPLGANVTRMLRRPRPRVETCSGKEPEFIQWMQERHGVTTPAQAMEKFRVSRATAYRWLASRNDAQRRAA